MQRITGQYNQTDHYQFQYNCASLITGSDPSDKVSWNPDTYEASGEVGDYNPTTDEGSHAVGNRTTHVGISFVDWYDSNGAQHYGGLGSWFAANQANKNKSTDYQFLQVNDSGSFSIWDNRCA